MNNQLLNLIEQAISAACDAGFNAGRGNHERTKMHDQRVQDLRIEIEQILRGS